jgi:hypothetical protein
MSRRIENRAGQSIRIESEHILRSQREASGVDLLYLTGTESQTDLVDLKLSASHSKQAKSELIVDGREDLFFVLEVVDGGKAPGLNQAAEKRRSRRISSNSCRQYEAATTSGTNNATGGFGEYRVGIDVAAACERVAPGVA